MARGKSNLEVVWDIFMNSPGPECVALYADVTKILTSRNIIKPPRVRKDNNNKVRRRITGKEEGTAD